MALAAGRVRLDPLRVRRVQCRTLVAGVPTVGHMAPVRSGNDRSLRVVRDRSLRSLMAEPPNMRLKLAARADCGMTFSSARRSLSAIR